jgi:GMP synthase-like glutamine amidotransferase
VKEILVLKHVETEDAGTIRDFMLDRKIMFRSVNLYSGDAIPKAVGDVAGAIIMGGPMNVYEEEKYPFLKKEDDFIKLLIKENIPCFGVCLGSQLIAKAMGARVRKSPEAEIGWHEVTLTTDAARDTVFSQVGGSSLKVLQWHEDTFDLPKEAVLLAEGSGKTPNQAYVIGDAIYGLQFHVEVNRRMLKEWFKRRDDLAKILQEYEDYKDKLKKITDKMYSKFFDKVNVSA